MRHGSFVMIVAALALTLLGCTGTQSLSDGEVESSGMVQDQARQTDAEQQVSSQGKAAHLAEFRNTEQDGNPPNLRVTGTGPQTTLASKLVDLSSPKDVSIESLTLTVPGPDGEPQKTIELNGLSASASDPIAAYNQQVEQITAATENMTDAQREQVIQAAKSLENVVPELAKQIINAVTGTP